ncbi:hypothetical protein Taro_051796 [Colocasia esculenta]|uniref:Uncharacterized protein n=1 Tax=Colocasia esculenta TaxID=4460 RepID=A0A843XH01_COLES|nr:hypothetical protein [Colocasia esculenta]
MRGNNFLTLRYLNLSFNDFDGEIPKGGIFQNVSVMGNHKLCGGILALGLSACSPRERNVRRRRHIPWKTVIIVSGKVDHPNSPSHGTLASYSELFKATEGFSLNKLIGVGNFGSVYRAN